MSTKSITSTHSNTAKGDAVPLIHIDVSSPGDNDQNGQPSDQTGPSQQTNTQTTQDQTTSLNPPGNSKENSRTTRSNSPTRLLQEWQLKINSHMDRWQLIQNLCDQIMQQGEALDAEEVESLGAQLNEQHKAFTRQHELFEISWPDSKLPHPYFEEKISFNEAMTYSGARTRLAKLKAKFRTTQPETLNTQQQIPANQSQYTHSHLPDIKLPKFTGDFAAWPPFRDLFKSLVVDHPHASDISKLHHLISCLSGDAHALVKGLPMVGQSFSSAWTILNAKYENKRLLINAQMEKVFMQTTPIKGDAASLNQLVTQLTEGLTMLRNLGVVTDYWSHVLVFFVNKCLDRETQVEWEKSLTTKTEYPSFDEMMQFLDSRLRTLQWLEPSTPVKKEESSKTTQQNTQRNTQKPASPPKKPVVAYQAQVYAPRVQPVQQADGRRAYVCDCCQQDHFMTACPQFNSMTANGRYQTVIDRQLCLNCFGRHYVKACKSKFTCKICRAKHHTLIHDAIVRTRPATAQPTQQQRPTQPIQQAQANQASTSTQQSTPQ